MWSPLPSHPATWPTFPSQVKDRKSWWEALGSPLRFLMKSSSFILRSALTLGLYMSVLRRMMAKARMKMVSGFRNWRTRAGLHTQYRLAAGQRGQDQGQAPVISTYPPSSHLGPPILSSKTYSKPWVSAFLQTFSRLAYKNHNSHLSWSFARIYVCHLL